MLEDKETPPALQKPDFDSLLADLFGLNIRGVKTLYDLFRRPKAVFESARVFDWRSKYTPTLRLAFSILTVFSLLSFFWAAEDGVLYQTLLSQFSAILGEDHNAPSLRQRVDTIFAGYNFIYPFAYMLVHGLVGSMLFFWGKGTSWVARLRLYFAVISVGLVLSVASVIVMPLISSETFWVYSLVGLSLNMLAYMLTYARGMQGRLSMTSLIIKAPLIAVIVTVADIIAATASGTVAELWSAGQF
ncbi:MAG: hypothetical protein ACE37M_08340 [Henriciella sp.]